jgi:CRISPR-associated protein Csm1
MDDKQLLDATCRVAFSAYLHDLGKFAERARLPVDEDKREHHEQMYCPRHEQSGRIWYTHKHAAYTALAWDIIERGFPELVGKDVLPFAAWGATDVDDSIVNAASRHHKPDTFLQWIVATADRVASGFEREEFDAYNAAEDRTPEGRNHYTARQLTLFEQIRIEGDQKHARSDLHYRYPLVPLSARGLFPVLAQDYETADSTKAQAEYRQLWEAFTQALQQIPRSHRSNWPLWLDHFDSAWACYTQAIPAATAFNVRPEVSLYDHSRTTAALAVAIWRYHHENGHDPDEVRKRLSHRDRPDWEDDKLLLVQGDFFGIQDFIFATGGETQRRAAKLLRGRSLYVSLLCECAALRILDRLALPPTSQVVNAAGKFLIVAPNTEATHGVLRQIQAELDAWFLEHTFGQSGIGIAWLPARCNDFLRGRAAGTPAPFRDLIRRLFEQLHTAKTRRFDLCGASPPSPVFQDFLGRFNSERGACAVDGRSPGTERLADTARFISELAADQIAVGTRLAGFDRVLITDRPLSEKALRLPLFGYRVQFTGEESETGRFGEAAASGALRRAWDFSLPDTEDAPLFGGYARRYINGHVPTFGEQNAWDLGRYKGLPDDLVYDRDPSEPKTLEHLACDDKWPDGPDRYRGVEALVTLKGDVDNLGSIFERGLEQPSFAKMAALSRQMNAFFAVWLPWLCQAKYPSTYTVFAGGDDFFLIGPWRSTIRLAREMRECFGRYVAANPDIHFSAGLAMTKPGLPIRQLGELAEDALDAAKSRRDRDGRSLKNAVTCFGHTVAWDDYGALLDIALELEQRSGELALSTGYLYGLQHLADMSEDLRLAAADSRHRPRVDSALWNARFAYRTRRMLEAKRGMPESDRRLWQQRLGELLGEGIRRHGVAFKVALFTHLYHHRH